MSVQGKCEICYQEILSSEVKKYCNNCGNDYHQRCINLLDNNLCPTCKQSFSDNQNKKNNSTKNQKNYLVEDYNTEPFSTRGYELRQQNKKENSTNPSGQFRWYHLFIFLQIINFFLVFSDNYGDGRDAIKTYFISSAIILALSPILIWGIRNKYS
ncbi:MAG: E3 ubiquitin protein ligase [Candidatus Heimdallarchaeota archaeon]|nr:E3 ubiquitin protein ligase [Candidatus Heimdallarchaeota archaeon]